MDTSHQRVALDLLGRPPFGSVDGDSSLLSYLFDGETALNMNMI